MNIKTFSFPPFEEWLKNQTVEQEIGAYVCFFKLNHYSYSTEILYQAYIVQYCWNKRIVIFKSTISCSPNDYYQLKKWYNYVIAQINTKWTEYILKTYLN